MSVEAASESVLAAGVSLTCLNSSLAPDSLAPDTSLLKDLLPRSESCSGRISADVCFKPPASCRDAVSVLLG